MTQFQIQLSGKCKTADYNFRLRSIKNNSTYKTGNYKQMKAQHNISRHFAFTQSAHQKYTNVSSAAKQNIRIQYELYEGLHGPVRTEAAALTSQ